MKKHALLLLLAGFAPALFAQAPAPDAPAELKVPLNAIGKDVADKVKAERDKIKAETPVLMIGDSMMRLLGGKMEAGFKKADVQPATAFSSLGSGLVRSSVFDWTAKINELLNGSDTAEGLHPKTVFVVLGTNDRQTIELVGGGTIAYEAAEWPAEYARRISGVMDQLIEGKVDTVVWLLLPPMKAAAHQEHAALVNKLVTEAASAENRRDKVFLYDLGPVLSKKPGEFTGTIMAKDLRAVTVRDPDGVHLTADGAKIVSSAILQDIFGKK